MDNEPAKLIERADLHMGLALGDDPGAGTAERTLNGVVALGCLALVGIDLLTDIRNDAKAVREKFVGPGLPPGFLRGGQHKPEDPRQSATTRTDK